MLLSVCLESKFSSTQAFSIDEIQSGEVLGEEVVLDNLAMFSNYSFKIRAHTQVI